jgi:hypothetical protein
MMIDLENCIIDTPNLYVDSAGKIHAIDGEFTGNIDSATITGSTFNIMSGAIALTTINNSGFFQHSSGSSSFQVGYYAEPGYLKSNSSGLQLGSPSSSNINITPSTLVLASSGHSISLSLSGGLALDGQTPITEGNVSDQYVKGITNGARLAYLSANDNFIPISNSMYLGSNSNKWAGLYTEAGNIVTSDANSKKDIQPLDERFIKFTKLISPKMFRYKNGTSGRTHLGFIAQEIEAAMLECEISDLEFAGFIKSPRYAKKLLDKDGNELPEYDTTSENIGYNYGLRYDEFIPLLLLRIMDLEERLSAIENQPQ